MNRLVKYGLPVAGAVFGAVAGYLGYLGAFKQLKVEKKKSEAMTVLVLNYQGPYGKQLHSLFSKFALLQQLAFKKSKIIGLYFDAPCKVENQSKCRAQIGLLLDEQDLKEQEEYIKNHPDLKLIKLPGENGIYVEFPYRNQLSYMIAFKRIYSALHKYIVKSVPELQKPDSQAVSIEIYPHSSDKEQKILTYLVYGEQLKYYLTSPFEAPAKKQQKGSPLNDKKI